MKWSWRGLFRLSRLSETQVPASRLSTYWSAKTLTRVKSPRGQNEVELEGIEPSSKQGRPVLSTRLFQSSFSCIGKTWTTNQCLSL